MKQIFLSFTSTYHYDLLVVSVDGMAVDHADDGHAQVTSDPKGDAEANTGEDSNDVASGQTETRAVHHRHLLLFRHLRPALRRQLNGLAIFLFLLKSSVRKENTKDNTCTQWSTYRSLSSLKPTTQSRLGILKEAIVIVQFDAVPILNTVACHLSQSLQCTLKTASWVLLLCSAYKLAFFKRNQSLSISEVFQTLAATLKTDPCVKDDSSAW